MSSSSMEKFMWSMGIVMLLLSLAAKRVECQRKAGKMYVAIAAPPGEPSFSRAFNKTLMNITQGYLPIRTSKELHNITLDTLVVELPVNGSFSSGLLEQLCGKFEGKHVVAILLIGDSPAAFTVSLAATYSGIPVLWARGQGGFLTGFSTMESHALEMHLAPTGREVVQALRGVLLQAHWHTFTLLADRTSVTALQRLELWAPLAAAPLHPTLVPLPSPLRAQQIFRKLADISRSTRGVVVLMTNRLTAVRILEDAKRLNMLDGHFVWIWIDTHSRAIRNFTEAIYMQPPQDEFDLQRDQQQSSQPIHKEQDQQQEYEISHNNDGSGNVKTRSKRSTSHINTNGNRRDYLLRSELSDMNVNYLLKNDQFLLFNHRNNGVESSKKSSSKSGSSSGTKSRAGRKGGGSGGGGNSRSKRSAVLPLGLLSIRPVPIKIDRHLVKGTVRMLVSALRIVFERVPDWLVESFAYDKMITSCWKPQRSKELNFSTMFGRELKTACTDALAGKKLTQDIGVDKLDKSLVANFEILNLVPDHTSKDNDLTNPNNSNNNNNSNNYNNNNINMSNLNNASNSSSSNTTGATSSNNSSFSNAADYEGDNLRWKRVGIVSGRSVRLDTIVWPGGDLSVAALSTRARTVFRVVTALAPPFVMESELDEDGQCLRGLPCHRVLTADKDNLTLVFNEMEYKHRLEEEEEEQQQDARHANPDYVEDDDRTSPFQKFKYRTHCCYGLAMDLLENVAQELEFDFRLYIVADGLFGSKKMHKKTKSKREVGKKFLSYRFGRDESVPAIDIRSVNGGNAQPHDYSDSEYEVDQRWNGIVGDLVSGAAHMSFAPLSVSSSRSEVIDYSVPYFFSGVSFLAAPQQKSEIPLMAFLLPFSPELWIAIFTSLNITAIAVAIYEWLSPFGLNPWGRQRSKNFSMSSALWVMWGLLCGHLVAFKAPKSWPNKFLINVWGGFSVIFVASYTANIAALIAGLFFQNTVSNYHDRSLLSQKVGAPKASASEFYVQKANRLLWEHMHKFSLENVEDGIERLRNGSLDILIADTPILDYYRATDHGCKLQKIGDTINEDTYAIGMTKGFPLKDTISAVIAKYSSNGYMDILQEKWYGGLPCFKLATEIAQPRPLGVAAVTGVFILLGLGMVMGLLILLVEHLFFRYTLPLLREKPKGSVWRSRNIMFFSQKLYRFINCVELVSPHHAARELVHTIRQGQITSLFQKSIKRKEHEQRRRRKSKAQFFEMIQEIRSTIRRQQQEEREQPLESVAEVAECEQSPANSPENNEKKGMLSPSIIQRTFKRSSPKMDNTAMHNRSPTYFNKPLIFSPRSKSRAKSSSNLNVRRFSTDSVFNNSHSVNRNAVGRRLSKDASQFLSCSPPDINSRRSSNLDIVPGPGGIGGSIGKFKSPVLSIENVSDMSHERKLSDAESIGRKLATLPKYRDSKDKDHLQPQYSLRDSLGKSDEALCNKTENRERLLSDSTQSRSYTNILDPPNNNNHQTTISNLTSPLSDPKSSDDETTRRNKQLQMELQNRIAENIQRKDNKQNPHIRIQVEDTSSSTSTATSAAQIRKTPGGRKTKRHQSLSGPGPEPVRRTKLPDQSKSLDTQDGEGHGKCQEHNLPPAPPPPNCSPRNSNGRSPLERLSKDELVLLWRSSESELRSHLLKAIRDKEEVTEKPP